MKTYTRRLISLVAALTLLVTCVITGLVLPATAGVTNLVNNGDFEQGATGWTSSSDIKEGVGKDGSWGLEMPVTSASTMASSSHWYSGNICSVLEVGETYVVSLDYNITKGSGTFVQFDVFADAALNQWLKTQKVHQGVTDGWQTWTYEFTVGDSLPNVASNVANGYTFEIRAVNYGVASQESMAYVDNVSIVKKSELEEAAATVWCEDYEGDTRVNGIKSWTAKGEITADPKDATNKALKLTAAASTTYNGASMGLEKNKVYALSLDYMGGSVTVKFNGSKGFFAPGNLTYAATDDWKTVTYYIVTKDTMVSDGYTMNLNAPVDTYLDNITLKEIGDKGDIAADTNGLLPGADFEAANPAPWKSLMDQGATIVADPSGADNKVLYFPAGYGKGAYWNYMSQGLEPNTAYTISMDVYGDAIWLYLNGDKGITEGAGWIKIAATGNEWSTVTHNFTTGSSVENGIYMLGYGVDINSTTGLYMDNVKITEMDAVLTGITLNKTTATVTAGKKVTLTATAVPADAPLTGLTWESNNEAVATVADGVVTAVAAGTATITAKVGDITATCTVTVEEADLNVLYEDDFENGAQGLFAGATTANWSIADGGVNGGKALAIGYKVSDRWLKWNTLTFEANTRYSITFLAKGPEVRFSCYKYAGSATVLGDTNIYTVPYQDGWTQYRYEFITGANGYGNDPNNSNYGLFFTRRSNLADTTAVTLIDNFKIEKTDETSERVLGGDFTYPGMQQWNGKHLSNSAVFSVVADPADATNKVFKIAASDAALGDKFLQNLYLEAGLTYQMTVRAKGAPVSFYFHPNSVTGDVAGEWASTEETADWKTYTYVFTAGTSARDNNDWVLNITRNAAAATDSYLDDLSIAVTEIPNATAIELNKTSLKLGVSGSETLTVATTPDGAKYDSLSWVSSDPTVATVVDGVVTGVKAGTATITATAMVGTTPLTATCEVNVVVKATAFNIVQDEIYLSTSVNNDRVWAQDELILTTTPADADTSGLTWSSNNTAVATVENGIVKAHAAGTATITVTNGEVSDTVTVKVDDQGERISGGDFEGNDWNVEYWTKYIIKSGSGSLEADPTNADNTVLAIPGNTGSAKWMWPAHVTGNRTYKLTFKAMNADGQAVLHVTPDYAANGGGWLYKTIATEGWTEVTYIISTVAPGDLNRNYLFGFGNQKSSTLYIDDVSMVELPLATDLTIENVEVPVKGSAAMKVTTTPAEASIGSLTWTSSDPSIISVDASGKLKAVGGSGSVTITVTNGTITKTATATITGEPATAIKTSKTKVYLPKNGETTLTVNTVPAIATYAPFAWTSSDTTIATVDDNGKVTVTDKLGTAIITVTSGELTATCEVTVMNDADSFVLKDETIKLAPGIGGTLRVKKTLDIVTTPANTYAGEVTWSSSDDSVATVDENGQVTAVAAGTATITVSKNGTPVDTCEVVVVWNGERITGGDFEDTDWNVPAWTNNIVKAGKGSITTDPADENNTVLALPNDNSKLDALWISNLHVNAGKSYKLTFKVKGDGVTESQQLAAYFHGTSTSLNGWKYTSLNGEWKEVSYVFATNALDNGTSAALNRNYCFGIDNNREGTIYLDDFSMVELPDATALELGDEVKLWPTGSLTLGVQTVPAEASAGKLTWTSSDPNVVAIDQNGRVTAVADSGEATITVTNGTLSDTVKVVIDEYANLLENGDFEQGGLNWDSAAVIQAGVGKDGSSGMVLDNPVSTTKKDFYYKGNLPMDPGTTYIVEWDYLPTTDAEFRLWAGNLGLSLGASSGNGTEWKHGSKIFTTPTSMVDINNAKYKGWVFAVVSDIEGASQAIVDNITIKLYNSGVKAESIKLTQDKLTMMPGRTENLGIMATPANGDVNKSIWTSSDENVATVEYGIVTAVGKGTATITATTRDGVSASCEVTVSGNPAFITNGTFDDATDNTWGMTGGTAIENGIGTLGSKAASIAADGTLTYEIKDLQPETTYQFFIRHRSPANGKLKMTLVNGEEDLLKGKTVGTSASWAKETYEFTTGTTVADTYKLTLAPTDGTGPIYVDNILLTQKATLIDFVVESLVWTDGEQVKPGTELLFAVFISNIGKDPVKAGSTINIDICMDSKPIQTLTYTFETEFAAGAITDAPIMSTEPWAAVKGDHVISARVNSTLSVLESNTDNNNMVQSDLRVYDEILEVPELAEQAGFTTLDFSDDFNSLDTIDMGATGADGYKWYVTRPYGSTSLTTEDYSIDDGILTMKNVIPTYNMGFSSADCKTGRGYAFNQGYLEYRIRIPRPRENTKGEDGIPAVWSLPLDKLMSVRGSDWVEMDWMEYWGFDGGKKPEGYYTITLHDQGTDENDVQTWYNKNKNYSKRGLGDGEWHTMAFLWVQDLLLGYLDGEEVFRLAYDENSFSDPMQSTIVPDERGGLGAFSYMNIQELVLHIGGSKDNPLEMDYIRVWTSVGGSEFTPDLGGDDDEELGDGDFIVDIPAMDFWENYCTDDWGDPITVIDEYNYEYILMGGEYWSYLSDERKAEINALLAANGQPTFEELLAMAQAFANGEEPPATGVTTALPAVASAMLISAAGLWVSRKRKK